MGTEVFHTNCVNGGPNIGRVKKILTRFRVYQSVFYPDTLGLGGNYQHWGEMSGVWGLCPQRGPGAEPLVRGSGCEALQKVEAFCCIISLFWCILEGIVKP